MSLRSRVLLRTEVTPFCRQALQNIVTNNVKYVTASCQVGWAEGRSKHKEQKEQRVQVSCPTHITTHQKHVNLHPHPLTIHLTHILVHPCFGFNYVPPTVREDVRVSCAQRVCGLV